jgi:hypothetical protein
LLLARCTLLAVLLAPAMGRAAPGDAPPKGAAVAPAPGAPGARMTPDAAAKIPDGKKVEIAAQSVKDIKKNVERVGGRSDQARKDKDVGKLNCLNLQLTQMRALAKVAQAANEALVDAVGKQDSATANTQFTRVVVAADKVQRMGGEAEVCLGQLAFLMDGRTSVDVDQPPDLPSRDVTLRKPMAAPFEAPPIVRPLSASRYY